LAIRSPTIGVIGLGHWFERLSEGLSDSTIVISKAMGRKSFEERMGQLTALGVSRENYYIGSADGVIPEEFFEGLDAIYVSSPNSLHCRQTMQILERGRYAVVEKTLATNEPDFNEIMRFLEKDSYEPRTYLHVHYIHKQLTMNMGGILGDLIKDYGKVKGVSATFLESYCEADVHRQWIFSKSEGGVFMDWIHPYEILFNGARVKSSKLLDARFYIMNDGYCKDNPSGVEALSVVNGEFFEENARATIRVGKGSTEDVKRVRFYFDDDVFAEFNFLSSEKEFVSDRRGSWKLIRKRRDDYEVLKYVEPSGPNPSQIFASDIIKLCNGQNVGLTIAEIKRLYAPQWEFQRYMCEKTPIVDREQIKAFIVNGSLNEVDGYTA